MRDEFTFYPVNVGGMKVDLVSLSLLTSRMGLQLPVMGFLLPNTLFMPKCLSHPRYNFCW